MRYFVYRDSRIVGPFAPEELHQAGDLSHETLVCEESLTGGRDADWRPLREVLELSQVRVLEPVFFDEAPPGLGPGGLERLELDALGVPEDDDQGAAWIRALFEDSEFRGRFAGLLPKTDDDPRQLSLAKSRIAQLSGELEALRARLSELENTRHAQWKTVDLPKILESAMSLPPAAEPPKKAFVEPPSLPAAAPQTSEAAAPTEPPRSRLRIASSAPLSGTPLPETPEPAPAPARGLKLKIASSGGLPVADPAASAPAPAPEVAAAEPAGPVFDWQEPEPRGAQPQVLPEAKALPAGPIAPAPEETPIPPGVRPIELQPLSEAAPAPAAPVPAELEPAPISLQPAPISLEAPAPAETSSLQAVPLPPFGAAAPLTAVFGPGETAAASIPAAPGLTGAPLDLVGGAVDLGSAGPGLSDASVADVVARLARPAPTQIPAPKPPRRGVSRLLLAALFGLTAAVAGAFFLFLRNPRDLKTMVAMGSDQKPLGVEAQDESALKPATPNPPSVAQPLPVPTAAVSGGSGLPIGASSPAPVAPQPAAAQPPAAAPVQPAPAAPEGGDAAIALVKGFPLDGDRGTVGQWLQYSFAANPGDGNKEEWTAAAGDDPSTYIVQYQVQPGPNAASAQTINYVFEADLQRQIVRGNTDNARELLAGGEPAPVKKPKAAIRKKKRLAARRPKPDAAAAADKPLSLLPLPTDAELVPPAEDDSSFQDPTVLQQPGQ